MADALKEPSEPLIPGFIAGKQRVKHRLDPRNRAIYLSRMITSYVSGFVLLVLGPGPRLDCFPVSYAASSDLRLSSKVTDHELPYLTLHSEGTCASVWQKGVRKTWRIRQAVTISSFLSPLL
jgi:hypothetical protein